MFITIDKGTFLDGVYRYEGETDCQGRACGIGVAKKMNVGKEKI